MKSALLILFTFLSMAVFGQKTVDFEKVSGGATMVITGPPVLSYHFTNPIVTISHSLVNFALNINDQVYIFNLTDHITINGVLMTSQTTQQISDLLTSSVFQSSGGGGGGGSNTHQALTDGSTITWDYSLGNIADVSISGNRTLSITNPVAYSSGLLFITHAQPNTTLTLPGKSPAIVTYSLDSLAKDAISFFYDGTTYYWDWVNYGIANPTLRAPQDLKSTVVGSTEVDLIWRSVRDATVYILERATNSTFTTGLTTIYQNTDTFYNNTSLSSATQYYYRVKATAFRFNNSQLSTTTATTGAGGDADVTAWVNWLAANGATQDATHQGYMSTFILGLKTDGLWTKIQCLYVPIFASAAANKPNIKNCVDADGSFRLTFAGTWTHGSNGMTPDGSTAYADTHFNTSTNGTQNSLGLGEYYRSSGSGTKVYQAGNYDGSKGAYIHISATNFGGPINSVTESNTAITATRLNFNLRSSSGAQKLYRDGTLLSTTSQVSSTPLSLPIYLGAINQSGVASFFGDVPFSLAIITDGTLSDADVSALNTRINTFMTSWGINL